MPQELNELALEGRKFLKNFFGSAFEAKATDAFCINYITRVRTLNGVILGAEVAGIRRPNSLNSPTNIILEMQGTKTPITDIDRTISPNTIAEIEAAYPKNNPSATALLKRSLQSEKIRSSKNSSIHHVQSFVNILEKKLGDSFIRSQDSIDDQPFLTQYCWLNHTMKMLPKHELLAEAAEDPLVTKIDTPRKLKPEIQTTCAAIFAPQYRAKFPGNGKGISVAILDSEVDLNHPAYNGRVIREANFTTEPWGNPDTHATAIAGIIGSGDPNYLGVAPEVTMYNYKVLATQNAINADDFGGVKAIEKALEDGMQIANCSWGVDFISSEISREARACNAAWQLGLMIVKSAGNYGDGRHSLTTPAEADGVLVVGATDKNISSMEKYSGRGPLLSGVARPHLVAPGGSQTNGLISCQIGQSFGPVGSGTSYAAPHVTGILSLILQQNPQLSNDELRDFAINLCTKLNGFSENDQGYGAISLKSLI